MSGDARSGPRWHDYVLLGILGAIWGSTYMFIEVGLRGIPPLTLAAARVTISLAILGGLALALGHRFARDAKSWRAYAAIGLFGMALPFALMTIGQTHIDSSMAAIIMPIMPLFTLGLAHFFTDDKASPRKLAGVALGFGGILLLLGPAAFGGRPSTLFGQLLYVGVALCYSAMQVLVRRLDAGSGTLLVRAASSMLCGALCLVPLALIVERPWTIAAPGADALLAALALGILATTVAHMILFLLNARAGPNFVAANNYIAPPVGIFWGTVLLGEIVTWDRIAAMIVIFAGIALAVTRTGVARRDIR